MAFENEIVALFIVPFAAKHMYHFSATYYKICCILFGQPVLQDFE